jgi:hypothetical protein
VMNRTSDRSTLPMPHTRVERDQEPREHTAGTPTGARASLVVGRFLFLTRPSCLRLPALPRLPSRCSMVRRSVASASGRWPTTSSLRRRGQSP